MICLWQAGLARLQLYQLPPPALVRCDLSLPLRFSLFLSLVSSPLRFQLSPRSLLAPPPASLVAFTPRHPPIARIPPGTLRCASEITVTQQVVSPLHSARSCSET